MCPLQSSKLRILTLLSLGLAVARTRQAAGVRRDEGEPELDWRTAPYHQL